MGPFEFTKTINETKRNLIDEDPEVEKDYIPFLVNRSLGYFMDTIMYANEMNQKISIDHKLQYDFLLNIIRPRKRFSKWLKKSKDNNIDLIKNFYGYSYTKAKDVVDILSEDQLEQIRSKLDTGGLRKE
jgi:hypothetical protein|tara:strand:- start:107 stop:493 length:387 start_codon:yes stop_codon:yes gene_type:complete